MFPSNLLHANIIFNELLDVKKNALIFVFIKVFCMSLFTYVHA